jgi:hypothetical protein
MDWKFIDTQADLDFFEQSVCWDDSELFEFCGTRHNENYFPHDISRSGYLCCLNLHALYEVCSAPERFLHVVLIQCEHLGYDFLHPCFWRGKVDTLKRVEIQGDLKWMRCARMIYRFVPEGEVLQPIPYLYQPYLCRLLAPPEY